MHPGDAEDAAGLVAAARSRLPEREPSEAEAQRESYEPPAFSEDVRVSRGRPAAELREELDRWAREGGQPERRDIWRDLAGESGEGNGPDDEAPQADVTPLYPPPRD